jgi:hypothetical protein
MTEDVRRELDRLLSALCDGRLTGAEHARLEHLLDADVECRRLYLEYIDMHGALLRQPFAQVDSTGRPAPRRRRRWAAPVLRYGLVSAATLAASLLVQVLFWPRHEARHNQPTPDGATPVPVATLVRAVDCVWDDAGEPRRAGTRLPSGELRLQKGLARVHFDAGPELVIEGPSAVRLDTPTSCTVLHGKVVFRGDEAGVAFNLHTPSSTLLDRGTEYAVSVGQDGEEVQVFDGEVERLSLEGKSEHIREREARVYGPGPGAVGRPTAYDEARFVRRLPPGPPAQPDDGLLAYEGFDYRDDSVVTAGTARGGRGWVGPWTLDFARPPNPGDPDGPVLNINRGLSRPGAPAASVGGAFEYTGFTKCYRRLAAPLRMDTDGTLYLSYLFCRHAPSDHPTNAVAVLFRTTEELDHENDDPRKRLNIGVGGSNEIFTHLNGVGSRTPVPLNYGETYLLVAKIVTGAAAPNQVFIRVYGPQEAVERDEPGNWTVVGRPFKSDLVFDWLEVHVNSKARQTIDEVRLGTTWASVTAPLSPGAPPGKVKP